MDSFFLEVTPKTYKRLRIYFVGMKFNLRGNLQKKKSPFKDIIQIKVDHPPTYPILDKLFFDKF